MYARYRKMDEVMKKIVVAGGCFWGVEEYYRRVKGIEKTKVGYAQGNVVNPNYEQVKSQSTNHAEAVELWYDENVISFEKIMELLFRIIDPTSLNHQGEDHGTQYRTGIYVFDEQELRQAQAYIAERQKEYDQKICVETEMLTCFYDAEDYHQKYLVKNPAGYCHVDFSQLKKEECK